MSQTVLALAHGLKCGQFSASELVNSYISDIQRHNERLNAYVCLTFEKAVAAAERADRLIAEGKASPLTGIPFILKDNICTRGIATTCCSRMLLNYIPPYSATVWERLQREGAILLGKGNMDEFAMGSTGCTSVFGPAVNPCSSRHVAGGSSGGVASAVGGGLAAFGLGSDTGGSVRQPAAFCGVVGFKPTYGAVPRYGLIAHASSLDQIGPITATAADASFIYSAICGRDGRDMTSADYSAAAPETDLKGLRVGVAKQLFAGCAQDVKSTVEHAICVCERAGANIIELNIPSLEEALSAYYVIACAEASSNLGRYDGIRYGLRGEGSTAEECVVNSRTRGFGDEVKRRIMLGTFVLTGGGGRKYYSRACALRSIISAQFAAAFENCDVIMSPTSPVTAYALDSVQKLSAYISDVYTVPASLAGLPSISIPCGCDGGGLPVGLQIMAARGGDALLLSAACAVEQIIPFGREEAAR